MDQQLTVESTAVRFARLIAYQLVGLQAVVVVVISSVYWWINGITIEALSAFLGGTVCLLSNFCFAWRLFAVVSFREAKRAVVDFFLWALMKFVLSAILVIFVVVFIQVAIVPFIIGFVGAQFGFFLSCATHDWIFSSRLSNVENIQ